MSSSHLRSVRESKVAELSLKTRCCNSPCADDCRSKTETERRLVLVRKLSVEGRCCHLPDGDSDGRTAGMEGFVSLDRTRGIIPKQNQRRLCRVQSITKHSAYQLLYPPLQFGFNIILRTKKQQREGDPGRSRRCQHV